jgi:CelD/BcsL family acetyltransferase involved in cellulose biosynthesis
VALGLAIERALQEGAAEFDLLHGDEGYKFHWARVSRQLARLELHGPGPGGWCRRNAARWGRGARRLARRGIQLVKQFG